MKRKDINLIVPRSWNECSTQQLEGLSGLAIRRDMASQLGQPDDMTDRDYKLHAFLLLAGLKPECHTEFQDGEPVYWFPLRRSTWFKRTFCRKIEVPIRPWQMKQFIDRHLTWLDDPYTRLRAPYESVMVNTCRLRLFGLPLWPFSKRRLHCLDDRMTSCTYRQYIDMENCLRQYWATQKLAKRLSDDERTSPGAIRQQLHNLQTLRRVFMAIVLSPATHVVEEKRGGQVIKCAKVTYTFDEAQVDENRQLFTDRQVARIFPVLLQFYLSVQKHFATLYPDLYVHRDNEGPDKVPDFLRLEIESMSTIMKYQGFADYRAIYDSDAVHILRVLDNMAREVKERKRAQQAARHK